MSAPSSPGSPPPPMPSGDRLDSWKEIAAYLKRDVTTVQRWEKREHMPVHRHLHDKMGSVYALQDELDAWIRSRRPSPVDVPGTPPTTSRLSFARRGWILMMAGLAALALVGAAIAWRLEQRDAFWQNPIADAKFIQVTDFGGTTQSAAVSRDGRFVAFLSDRDGPVDVWMTQIGTGQFHNLTHDLKRELVNPFLRALGFSPDGALVTFWTRNPGGAQAAEISVWAVPILGGQPRPYLEGAAEFDWSRDGSRLVYHTPGAGDPMLVKDPNQTPETRQIFAAPAGLHSHFLLWSSDQRFIYFVQGLLPDRLDIWRIKSTGGTPERITFHDSRVSYPVFLNPRTLVYLATDSSGAGPWLYSTDVERRIPHRVSSGLDRYTSLAASPDGARLVVTLATTTTTLWRLSNTGTTAEGAAASRVALSTRGGRSPRLGPDYLLYVSSQAAGDSIWKQQGETATQLWTALDARIIGGPAIDRDGRRIAFSVRQSGQALLYVMNADGTGTRMVGKSLEWQGAPAWAPDGRSLTTAALDGAVPRLYTVPLGGGAPAPLGREQALDPVWSPDGRFVVFSGADIGTTFPMKAIGADGRTYRLPSLTLTRGARRLRFLPGGRTLVVLKGDIGHKNVWSIDLDTGGERQLTKLAPDFEVGDFDISPDGREIVLERAQAHSEVVLLDMPRR